MGRKEIIIFDNINQISDFAVNKWEEVFSKAVSDKGIFYVALSGGGTPLDFYHKLSCFKHFLPWDKAEVFLVDERFVPIDDLASNWRLIEDNLLKHVEVLEGNIHQPPVYESDREKAAAIYEDEVRKAFNLKERQIPRFDLIILGIGEDGHTASLFPGMPVWEGYDNRLFIAVKSEKIAYERLSMTMPVINNAENIIFLVNGRNKAAVLKRIIEEEQCDLPAAKVKPVDGNLFFLIDREAATYLSV
jgi:6-phosphogluconolactonase